MEVSYVTITYHRWKEYVVCIAMASPIKRTELFLLLQLVLGFVRKQEAVGRIPLFVAWALRGYFWHYHIYSARWNGAESTSEQLEVPYGRWYFFHFIFLRSHIDIYVYMLFVVWIFRSVSQLHLLIYLQTTELHHLWGRLPINQERFIWNILWIVAATHKICFILFSSWLQSEFSLLIILWKLSPFRQTLFMRYIYSEEAHKDTYIRIVAPILSKDFESGSVYMKITI